ncbi:hypothetical protein PR048_006218 [Dryococelus australis]|uniref:Uncharacterized protein n=1 Tax=Dryococelus australis TaxID=614101 RepID=A0ABQ9ICJ4_9NEOP|nr:hypothetical protein PR048_006218 [Dryococelus australis]
MWGGVGKKGRGRLEFPEKTRRPTASSGTILTCESPMTRPGIEPGSPWWEASVLIAQPSRPLYLAMLWRGLLVLGLCAVAYSKGYTFLEFYSALQAEKRWRDKGYIVMRIKWAIATKRKTLNWRTTFLSVVSCLRYLAGRGYVIPASSCSDDGKQDEAGPFVTTGRHWGAGQGVLIQHGFIGSLPLLGPYHASIRGALWLWGCGSCMHPFAPPSPDHVATTDDGGCAMRNLEGSLLLVECVGKPDSSVLTPTQSSPFRADARTFNLWLKVGRVLSGSHPFPFLQNSPSVWEMRVIRGLPVMVVNPLAQE